MNESIGRKDRSKKETAEERTYNVRPILKEKFTKKVIKIFLYQKVYDIIRKSLEDNLKIVDKYKHDEIIVLNKKICDEVKKLLTTDISINLKRYKILVQCFIGENKGQGVRIGSRCLWDTSTDNVVSAEYDNECLFAFCAAFGLYYY